MKIFGFPGKKPYSPYINTSNYVDEKNQKLLYFLQNNLRKMEENSTK